jgi:hypothetical protein
MKAVFFALMIFSPVASRESGDEGLDERLALFRPENIDDPGAG